MSDEVRAKLRVITSEAFQAFCTSWHFQAPDNSYSFKMLMVSRAQEITK